MLSNRWFRNFLKRYGSKSVKLIVNVTSDEILATKVSLKESLRNNEMISSMIATDMPTHRILSQTLIFEEETLTSAFKTHNLPKSHLTTCKNMGSLFNKALIYTSTISHSLKHTDKNLIPVQNGLTWNHLVLILTLAKQLKHNSQKWDDDVDRSVQFCNKIDEVINQHQLLYNEKELHRRQLPITSFFQHF